MPNVSVHFVLADRVLERWRTGATPAPFAPDDTEARGAFLLGALAPDLGYFPAGDRLFSELVHQVRSADLARSLLATARGDAQRAYAWGWATHLLADQAIHPLINRAAQDLAGRAPDDRAHMRVEFGLDVEVFRRYPRVGTMRPGEGFGPEGAAQLARAVEETYGWRMDVGALLRSHHVTARVVRGCVLLNRVATARPHRRPLHALARGALALLGPPTRILPEGYGRAPLLCAVLDPLPPRRWLIEGVEDALDRILIRFERHQASGLRELENYDLTTGEVTGAEPTSERARRALAALAARRAPVSSPATSASPPPPR